MQTSPTEESLTELVGHQFASGHYRIEHWENWLLTQCTGREPMPDGLVHPVALFHVPIAGVGTSITELFQLCGAEGAGSVGLESYDWEYFGPLREDIEYRMAGSIAEVERIVADGGAVVDRVAFRIEMFDGSELVARVTNRWLFRRVA